MRRRRTRRSTLAVILFLLSSAPAAVAAECRPAGRLRVFCTQPCGDFEEPLATAALALGFEIEVLHPGRGGDRAGPLRAAALSADVVISPGGLDIAPSHYEEHAPIGERARLRELYAQTGKRTEQSEARDAREVAFFRDYFRDDAFRDLPVLGVCYGMQMLAVAQRLPLVVDIQSQLGIPNRSELEDRIRPAAARRSPGPLRQWLGHGRDFVAYENHHQAVSPASLLGRSDLRAAATSHGGRILEAIEFSERPLALGVQFHPERSADAVSGPLFRGLLRSACERNRKRAEAGGVRASRSVPRSAPVTADPVVPRAN